jgi:hypothetical protein
MLKAVVRNVLKWFKDANESLVQVIWVVILMEGVVGDVVQINKF